MSDNNDPSSLQMSDNFTAPAPMRSPMQMPAAQGQVPSQLQSQPQGQPEPQLQGQMQVPGAQQPQGSSQEQGPSQQQVSPQPQVSSQPYPNTYQAAGQLTGSFIEQPSQPQQFKRSRQQQTQEFEVPIQQSREFVMPSQTPKDFSRPRKKNSFLREVLEFLLVIVAVVGVALLLRTFVLDVYEIPTGSMQPTIEENDRLFAEKISYQFGSPAPGDIVTFHDPDSSQERILIKRCIAVSGQTVDLREGKVYVDGQALDEPYVHGLPSLALDPPPGKEAIVYPYTVPDDMIWVMGDNRTNSSDSRYFGPIEESGLIGRAVFRIWPLNRLGAVD